MRRIILVGATVAACLSASTANASAATGSGTGELGSADVLVGTRPATQSPIAPCTADGVTVNSSPGVRVGEVAEFGRGDTSCTTDQATGRVDVAVRGERFRTDALVPYGGPRVRLLGYQASCSTTATGSSWRMQLTGLTGVTAPSTIPPNHTVTIPGRRAGDPPMARVVLNETIMPSPPDGSVRLNLMRVVFWPEGGPNNGPSPISGSVVVGTLSCDPFGW